MSETKGPLGYVVIAHDDSEDGPWFVTGIIPRERAQEIGDFHNDRKICGLRYTVEPVGAPPVAHGETGERRYTQSEVEGLLYDAFEAGWFDNHGESIAEAWADRKDDVLDRLRTRTGARALHEEDAG